MRPVAARRLEVVPVGRQPFVREQGVGSRVVERGPLELEPDELRRDRSCSLLHPLHQRAVRRVARVDREPQAGVRGRTTDELLQIGHGLHEVGERARVDLGDAAFVLEHRGHQSLGPVDQLVDSGRALALDERFEIPRDFFDVVGRW